ncbi:MAG: hypothetical protein AAB360_02355 [Patescibacteria group bacterium]
MRTKIFIDFDGTIFDTTKFRIGLFDICRQAGFSQEEIDAAYKESNLDYKFSPKKHLGSLGRFHEYDRPAAERRLAKLYQQTPGMVFSDALVFLERLDRNRHSTTLFSLGDVEFQSRKAESCGIGKYFDEVYYTEKQKWEVMEDLVAPDEKFIFVDDRGDTVYEISKRFRHSFALEINRFSHPTDPNEPTKSYNNIKIRDFYQLEKYLGAIPDTVAAV